MKLAFVRSDKVSRGAYCSQAFAVLVGVGAGAADVFTVDGLADDLTGTADDFTDVGFADDFTGAAEDLTGVDEGVADDLVAFEEVGLAVAADD